MNKPFCIRLYYLKLFIGILYIVFLMNEHYPNNLRFIFFLAITLFLVSYEELFFFILTASIIVPDIGFGQFTATQIALISSIISLIIIKKRKLTFRFFPFGFTLLIILWLLFTSIYTKDLFLLKELLKGLFLGFILIQYINTNGLNIKKSIKNYFYGLSLLVVPWYLENIFKLSSFHIENIRSASYQGIIGERYAIYKQDPNALAMITNIIFWAFVNILIYEAIDRSKEKGKSLLIYILISIASLLILIMTQSRMGIIVFFIGGIITIINLFYIKNLNKKMILNIVFIFLISLLIFGLIIKIIGDKTFYLNTSVKENIIRIYEKGLDDRQIRFSEALDIVKANPITGIGLNSYLYSVGTYSHNTFLDVAICSGIPGLILFILLTLLPIIYYLNYNQANHEIKMVMITYLLTIISMMSLSMIGDKIFWSCWFLLYYFKKKNQTNEVKKNGY